MPRFTIRPLPLQSTAMGAEIAFGAGRRILAASTSVLTVPCLFGCGGRQSALQPAGRDAQQIASLFWWMAGGATLIWVAVMMLTVLALRTRPDESRRGEIRLYVIGGGAVVPSVVLAVLLFFGLRMMPELLDHGPTDGMRIRVTGEQWWWRVQYELPDGTRFELANELRLPVKERVPLWLESADVVHAFWVPALNGKVDMIPGRTTRLALQPTRTGRFRGACAEYCGASHARMLFDVRVMERDVFDAWTRQQSRRAGKPETLAAREGKQVFTKVGCGACHTVRGTEAGGTLGPDLTHVGARLSLAAGVLDNDAKNLLQWLESPSSIKPGVHMPSFGMLPAADRGRLAAYLGGLE